MAEHCTCPHYIWFKLPKNAQIRVWGCGVDCFFILGVLVGNRPRKRFRYFFIPRDFGRLPPGFGRCFGRGFGRKNASDIVASLGIAGAIAWHVGWKIYRSIVSHAWNHANIFGPKINILRFAFERHVLKHLVQCHALNPSHALAVRQVLNESCIAALTGGARRGKSKTLVPCIEAVLWQQGLLVA